MTIDLLLIDHHMFEKINTNLNINDQKFIMIKAGIIIKIDSYVEKSPY